MLTVTFTQTAIEALGLTHTSHVLDAARMCSIKLYAMGTGITGSRASYHSHLGSSGTYLESQDSGHLFHHRLSSHRTQLTIKTTGIGSLHTRSGKTRTTGIAAPATVGLRQNSRNLLQARVLAYSKFVRDDIQNHCRQ